MPERKLRINEIFTPNDTPSITYVDREDLKLEQTLRAHCELPKMVVSVSGPSKSGKTVLINKVLDENLIIPVIGSGIGAPEDLWIRALQWMEIPATVTTTKSSSTSISGGAKGGGEVSLLGVAKGNAQTHIGSGKSWTSTSSGTFENNGLTKVIEEMAGSEFVIFLDDFHYIAESHREEIGRQIKVATDNGVKIITASVPHRTDDVVRSNPELRGRVAAVDVGYWERRHLQMIARQGFSELNIYLAPEIENRLCDEAMGSPQLMQTICYCLCNVLQIYEPFREIESIEINEEKISESLLMTSQFTDFSKMLSSLHAGPKTRGQERKEHNLVDGSMGDVYRAVLLAICSDPITMSFTYDDIIMRVRTVCEGDNPVGSSVTSCLEQMHKISDGLQPGRPVLAWDGDNLDITDPYFAFYLRSSDKLKKLGH